MANRTGGNAHALPGALLFLFLLSWGCLMKPSPPADRPPDSPMGPNATHELPAPGPFLENRDDVVLLETFLLEEGSRILKECGTPDGLSPVKDKIGRQMHLEAAIGLVRACDPLKDERLDRYVEEAIRDGREKEVRDQLHAQALAGVAAFVDKLRANPGPSNAVEAQLLNELINRHEWGLAAIRSALAYWLPYENGTARDELQLSNAYLGHLTAKANAEVMGLILDRYPWAGSPCQSPDLQALTARVQEKLDRAARLAEQHAEPGDEEWLSRWRGRLVGDIIPQFQYYRDQGWWVSILPVEVLAEIHIAYWENRTSGREWPTMEDAQSVLAQYRNQSRTLWTEKVVAPVLSYFEDEFIQQLKDWDTDVHHGAPAFVGTMAVRWPYAALDCPA